MPPFIPKKRVATSPPADGKATPPKKPKVQGVRPASSTKRAEPPKKLSGNIFSVDSDDSDSSLSSIDSAEFKNVSSKANNVNSAASQKRQEIDDDSDESDEVEWENAIHHPPEQYTPKEPAKVTGDIQFSVDADDDDFGGFAAASGKKKQGLSKTERETRIASHQLHVQFLLWHNAIRNSWLSDAALQKILMDQLPSQIKKEVEKWKRASGIESVDAGRAQAKKQKGKKGKQFDVREERDWGRPSQKLEAGKADLSSGDPIISLLKILSAYWKKRFAITAPGLRKRGYSTRLERRKEVNSYKNDPHDPEKHGERIKNLKEFRDVAKKCEGSRDVGAQLFTALLRGLGIEARLVASLQPSGFGATKLEEMVSKKETIKQPVKMSSASSESDLSTADIEGINSAKKGRRKKAQKPQTSCVARGKRTDPIDLESGSDVSSDSDDSVKDITPSLPKKRPARYDREVPYPIYWTEAISPITSKVYPASPLVLEKPVATNDELLANFEPRGAKADNVRLVMAYVVGYSADGTAKDITVRYLRKHIWPGKTKAFRFPVEKIPVYNKRGKISRYEDYDWFKHTLSPYTRSDTLRTAVDDVEDANELVPQLPEKKQVDDSVDTLTSLKASPDYVLERFLRREEAIRPGVKPDRTFTSGKGDSLKEEAVYRRSDVERCLTTESWHKEGRIPKLGEVPLKRVPVRAVTLTRKREAEEHERLTGEKQLQGLYSWDQTEYIIPPPIQNGVIPKNGFGNIDAFVPTMIPRGAAHIPLRGTVRICKKLEIDFAEAVVGFEFGNKRAVPVIRGVVVAKEHEKKVKHAWEKWSEEQKKKEEMKLEKLVLDMWRKFIVGLRIRKRVQEQYGEDIEMGAGADLPVHPHTGVSKEEPIDIDEDEDETGGGFMPGSYVAEEELDTGEGGGFFLDHSDDNRSEPDELIFEDHNEVRSTSRSRRIRQGADSGLSEYPTPATPELNGKDEHQHEPTAESYTDAEQNSDPPSPNPEQSDRDSEADIAEPSDDDDPPPSDLSSQEDDSYNPLAKRRSLRAPAPAARRTSGRVTPRAAEQTPQKTPAVTHGKTQAGVEVVVPGKPATSARTPSGRQGKKSTEATSPYFEQPPSSTGRARGRRRK